MKKLALLFCLFVSTYLSAQNYSVKGRVSDTVNHVLLEAVNVAIINGNDSADIHFATTQSNGVFEIKGLNAGIYLLTLQTSGYENYQKKISVAADVDLQDIYLLLQTLLTEKINIVRKVSGVEQKGDTVQYNAKAYKTNPDATAEDLLKKMPGVTVENGTVKAHGENVQKVTVDGKVFFGEDANIALKNLSSDMIDKVEVFDQMSDQSLFTGFDDGNSQKTINIITKSQMKEGTFGKIYAGYGTDNHYQAGGTLNFFKKDRRVSLLGLSNNVNQQNFSTQDIMAATGGPAPSPYGKGGGGNSPVNNFLAGSSAGITSVNSFGLNYSDQWGKKIKVSGSYFFNNANNINLQNLSRQYYSQTDTSLFYNEADSINNLSYNHRINFNFEYAIDSMNTLIIKPNISFQNGNSFTHMNGLSFLSTGASLNESQNTYSGISSGYKISNDALWRHKFQKRGRTISVGARNDWNRKTADNKLYALNYYYLNSESDTVDQNSLQNSPNHTYSVNLSYTEPIGKITQLLLNYKSAYSANSSQLQTSQFSSASQSYSRFDSTLSNNLQSNHTTQQPGIGYRVNFKKLMISAGADYQMISMNNTQTVPSASQLTRTFDNILPNAQLRYKFSQKSNVRLTYRTQVNLPSVTQLQDVWNNTNPLLLSVGNSSLRAPYNNNIMLRYLYNDPKTSKSLTVFAMAGKTLNYIANSTNVVEQDMVTADGRELKKGTRYTKPVNLDGYWNSRLYVVFGTPLKKLKSNINTTSGFSYSSAPTLVNGEKNFSNSASISQGVTFSSNISDKLDFTLTSTGTYNLVSNSLQSAQNYNYFNLVSSFKINYIFWKGLVLQSDVSHTLYSGLNQQFNINYLLWNAGIAKKLFKDDAGEIKISVFDALKQNNSVSRTVTETYVDDLKNVVLQQYFMLTFTYKIKKIPAAEALPAKQ